MKHPWARFRLNKGLTQLDVAELIGVERLSIIRYEQGMYKNPGHVRELAELYQKPAEELEEVYHQYQQTTRENFRDKYWNWNVLRDYGGQKHPLVHYREVSVLTRNELCKGLCLDYGPISEYEMNKQRTIPEVIRAASDAISWDWTVLEEAVLEWRASGRANAKRIRA